MKYYREPETSQEIADCINGVPLVIKEGPFPPNLKKLMLFWLSNGTLELRYTLDEDK